MRWMGCQMALSILFSFSLLADPSEPNIHYLRAEEGSDGILSSVEIQSNDAGYSIVRVEGEVGPEGIVGYYLSVNEGEGTYAVSPMDQLPQFDAQLKEEEIASQDTFYPLASLKPHIIEVVMTTVDPLYAPLCATHHQLLWFYDGRIARYHSRVKTPKAWSPTFFGTHWFTRECKYTLLDFGKGAFVRSQVYASYYNYDFGDPKEVTAVSHRITLTGLASGKSKYQVSWFKSGEGNWLLGLHIRVTQDQ